jgi:hypothetical protein
MAKKSQKPKKRGPKPKAPHLKMTDEIRVKMTAAEKRDLEKRASAAGVLLSEFVRRLCFPE